MREMHHKKRIAAVVSHPIQYHAPFFARLASEPDIDLTVYYSWDFGIKPTHDPEFKVDVKWDIPVLEGYKSVFLKNISPQPGATSFWGEINPGIVWALIENHYDAVIVYGWNFATSWFAFLGAALSGTPFFIRGENPWSQETGKSSGKRTLKKIILGALFSLSAGAFYIGKENKKFYEHYGMPEAKLFSMPYMTDNARFEKAAAELRPRKAELKEKLGLPPESFVILTAGKLIPKKRPLDLLRAYEKAAINNKALVYMGEGPLRDKVEEEAREKNISNVIITGFKNQLEMPEVYAAADVFVLPSEAGETWGLVVNEAMCFGVPVIVSDMVGSGPDLVHAGVNGFVFRTGDNAALSRYLEELAGDEAKSIAFGKRSLEIIKNYSFEKGIEGLREALKLS